MVHGARSRQRALGAIVLWVGVGKSVAETPGDKSDSVGMGTLRGNSHVSPRHDFKNTRFRRHAGVREPCIEPPHPPGQGASSARCQQQQCRPGTWPRDVTRGGVGGELHAPRDSWRPTRTELSRSSYWATLIQRPFSSVQVNISPIQNDSPTTSSAPRSPLSLSPQPVEKESGCFIISLTKTCPETRRGCVRCNAHKSPVSRGRFTEYGNRRTDRV